MIRALQAKTTWVRPMRAIYWFRRDLRLWDNRALARAYMDADEVIAVFVLSEQELSKKYLDQKDKWLKLLFNALTWMEKEIRIHVFIGEPAEVMENLVSKYRANAVYTAKPLSWSEKEQVEKVRRVCESLGARLIEVLDNVLVDPYEVALTGSFESFYRRWLSKVDSSLIGKVKTRKFIEIEGARVSEAFEKLLPRGSRNEVLTPLWAYNRLRTFDFGRYDEFRNYPYLDSTSRLSPFINIGVLSIREIYDRAVGKSREFVRQLAWRDYYYAIWVKYPWMKDQELKPFMRGIKWENNEYYMKCYMEGKTGYPIVDAGIRQLKTEGWIHNRIRLILASFLVKDLLVDWRIGEEFFRKYLVDYDEVLNMGNWQWAASTGIDPLPVRIFNPVKQAERYDPQCYYIRKYIPELEGEDCRALQNPLAYRIKGYVEPIVDHYERTRYFLEHVKKRFHRTSTIQ